MSCDVEAKLEHGSNHRPQTVLENEYSPSGSTASETTLACTIFQSTSAVFSCSHLVLFVIADRRTCSAPKRTLMIVGRGCTSQHISSSMPLFCGGYRMFWAATQLWNKRHWKQTCFTLMSGRLLNVVLRGNLRHSGRFFDMRGLEFLSRVHLQMVNESFFHGFYSGRCLPRLSIESGTMTLVLRGQSLKLSCLSCSISLFSYTC